MVYLAFICVVFSVSFFFFKLCQNLFSGFSRFFCAKTESPFIDNCLLFMVGFLLAEGVISAIATYLFYFNVSFYYAYYSIVGFSFLGVVLIYNSFRIKIKSKLHRHHGSFFARYDKKVSVIDLMIIFMIILMIFNYIYRSAVPWFDEDEISQYGLYVKLMASGWGYQDFLNVHTSLLGLPRVSSESLFGLLYSIKMNMIFPRLLHFFNFMNTALFLSIFVYIYTKSIRFACLGALLFICTPEFSFMMTSMKTDSTLMAYELPALLLLFSVLYAFDWKQFRPEEGALSTMVIALILISLAIAVRPTALYSAALIGFAFFIVLFRSSLVFLKKVYLMIPLFSCIALIMVTYLYNLIHFENPFYPLVGPWMSLFPHPQGYWSFDHLKTYYNLNMNWPKIFLWPYILMHAALGFDTAVYDHFSFIPHPIDKGVAYGWLTPCLLIFFIAPCFFKKSKAVFMLSLIFMVVFIVWLSGVQYTRVLYAASSLSILVACIIAVLDKNLLSRVQSGLVNVVRLSLFVLSFCLFAYQTAYSFFKYPHRFSAFYSEKSRYSANIKLLADSFSPLPGLKKGYYSGYLLSYHDVQVIDNYMSHHHSGPIVLPVYSRKVLPYYHILFSQSFLLRQYKSINAFLKLSPDLKSPCVLLINAHISYDSRQALKNKFHLSLLHNNHFDFMCVS